MQVPEELGRSKAVRGIVESIILSKKYAVPLAIISPWVAVGGVVAYVTEGRFNPEKHASLALDPANLLKHLSAFSEHSHDELPVTAESNDLARSAGSNTNVADDKAE